MDKLNRYQATLQLMHLIKKPKYVAENLLPDDRTIYKVADVEAAAAKYRANPTNEHWFYK
jgi:hypothetical protein